MPEHNDPMMQTLDTLRSDVERTPLADSLTVRRRGEARTRRQAVGVAVAAVAVVAAVIGVSGSLTGSNQADRGPVAVSPTRTPVALAADPLLQPGDIGDVGAATGWQRNPDPVDDTTRPMQCLSDPGTWGATTLRSALYYVDTDPRVYEHVLRFADSAAAAAAVQRPLGDLRGCPTGKPADVTVTDRPQERVPATGDEAYRAARLSTPTAASEPFYYELGVVRRADVVVVLEWTSQGKPTGSSPTDWVWTPERLQTALTRAVG